VAQQLQWDWTYSDFPHGEWSNALVEVNGEVVIPQTVEYGKASTGQPCCILTFEDGSRLDIWLDACFPKNHRGDYAVWKNSPFYDLTLSTCPEWKDHKCNRCSVQVEQWMPLDQIIVDLKFCERDDHKPTYLSPHARIVVRNAGYMQRRLGVEQ
jgi:hypothetical protein